MKNNEQHHVIMDIKLNEKATQYFIQCKTATQMMTTQILVRVKLHGHA